MAKNISVDDVKQNLQSDLINSTRSPIEIIKDYRENAESEVERSLIDAVVTNLENEFNYFNWSEAISDINTNKREATKDTEPLFDDTEADNLYDEHKELVDEVRDELNDEDITKSSAYITAKHGGLDDLADKINEVESMLEEVEKPYKELAEKPKTKKRLANKKMKGSIQVVMGSSTSAPEGVKTDLDE